MTVVRSLRHWNVNPYPDVLRPHVRVHADSEAYFRLSFMLCLAVSRKGASGGGSLLLSPRADVGADGFTERLHVKTYPKRLKGSFP